MSNLPRWLDPLYTADEMRALDAWAIEDQGVPSLELMERAGAEVARVVTALAPAGPVRVVCGKGNNGGDGLVVVRLLHGIGIDAEALLLADPHDLSPDARANHDRLVEAGARWRTIDAGELPSALEGSGAIVDALLGTGFEGAPRRAARRRDRGGQRLAAAPVVAVDVPSGVNASTGEVEGACVRADVTVTFHAREGRALGAPGKGACRPGRGGRHRHPRGVGRSAGARHRRPDRRAGAGAPGAARAAIDEVQLRRRAGRGRLDRPDRRGLPDREGAMRAGAGWVRVGVPASLNRSSR